MSNGIYNKYEMIDNVVALLNTIPVKGSENVVAMSNVYQMLFALKRGFEGEDNAKNKTIEMLKEQLKRATEPQVEEGGDIVGGQHYDLKFGGDGDG